MAFIAYVREHEIPVEDQVADRDNIIRIHGVHSKHMRHHHDLYVELMHEPGPLSRSQRETIAVAVSVINECHY